MKKLLFIVIALCFSHKISFAQCNYTLSGKVIDHHDREPLEFAEIFISELKFVVSTDSLGNYKIPNLCKGNYTVTCRHFGCEDIITQVKVDGNTIQNFYPEHHLYELGLIDIVTEKEKNKNTVSSIELKGKELEQKRGASLGEALKMITGVTTIQTGAGISKPVIHGLHSNRILILNNGIRQESQQWGNEHAPEIDPFIATKLTVIKGAAAVRYGADAIGGVILVEPNKLRDSEGVGGEFNMVGFTNGKGGAASVILEQNFKKLSPLSLRLQGTLKKSGNVKTPNYYMKNTGLEEYNFSGAMGWNKTNYGVELFYSQFNTNLGIFSGAHIGNVTDLQNAINSAEPIVKSDFSYKIDRPYQHIEHELFKANAFFLTGEKGKLNIIYARQYNLRNEYDAHKPKKDSIAGLNLPQLQFEITTHTADIFWEHNSIKHFTGSIGISGMQQGNTYEGRYFIPNFKSYSSGAYFIERFIKNEIQIELGVRYDYKYLQIFKYEKNVIISPIHKFDNTSATIGAIYKLNKNATINFNAGNAWRAPNVNELYSKGIHHGAATYEIGNDKLKTEKAYNFISGINYSTKKWKAEASVYYNVINDFIYLKPLMQPTVTISGAFPTFVFSQTNAHLYGLDAQLGYYIHENLLITGKTSLLRAKDVEANIFLIQMPADRYSIELTYNLKNKKKYTDAYITINGMYENEQWRVAANRDYAASPEAYLLLNCELGTTFKINHQKISIGISGSNLLNTKYRNYMNRFRYYSDEMGRNITLRIKLPFSTKQN